MNIKIIFYFFLSSSLYIACPAPKPVGFNCGWAVSEIIAWIDACNGAQVKMSKEILNAQQKKAQPKEEQGQQVLNHGFNQTNNNVINAGKQ